MGRTTITAGSLLAALLTGACSAEWPTGAVASGSSGTPAPASTSAGTSGAETAAPAADPFLVASYPTAADEDTAFVSEVAGIEGVWSYLTRTPFILGPDLAAASTGLAQLGRRVCITYDGDNLESVTSRLRLSSGVDGTVDSMELDQIDAVAFAVAAVGVYCPQELVDLGEGVAMTGGIEVRPVTPACPTTLPVTVSVSAVQLTGQSNAEMYGDFGEDNDLVYGDTDGLFEGAWTYTLTNDSDHDVLVALEEQVGSERYTSSWRVPTGLYGANPWAPVLVPAHGTAVGDGAVSGVYAWRTADYRVSSWMPLSCQVMPQ